MHAEPDIDPEIALDLLEERAAIIEEGDRVPRFVAEQRAAEMWGYRSWPEATMKIRRRIREARRR